MFFFFFLFIEKTKTPIHKKKTPIHKKPKRQFTKVHILPPKGIPLVSFASSTSTLATTFVLRERVSNFRV